MQQINNKSLLSFMVTAADNAVAVTNPATGELVGHAPISSEPELMELLSELMWRRKSGPKCRLSRAQYY